jgi:DNA-binding response OmpR family regulator
MPKIVAILEDEPTISQMYRFKLEKEGFTVEIAENGVLGLKLIESMHPDIILLDIMMPLLSGDKVLEKIRAKPWGKDIKVIILTNMGDQEIPPLFKELGVSDVIVKADLTPGQVADLVMENLGKGPS